MKTTTAASQHLFNRATEVDVDHVESMLDKSQRRGPKLLGVGTHKLAAHGVLFCGHVHEVMILAPLFNLQNKLVEHHLAKRVRSSQPPSDHPHRGIAVATERRLHNWKVERNIADLKLVSR